MWVYSNRCVLGPNQTDNIFVVPFTKAFRHLKLYSFLEPLQDRVLYNNTDSLIYITKDGQITLKLGNYLRDLTDELKGNTILEFVAAGPTIYAYQTRANKVAQCVKCCQNINFDSIRELVEGYTKNKDKVITAAQHNIVCVKKGLVFRKLHIDKKCMVVYDKRRLLSIGHTKPFGY